MTDKNKKNDQNMNDNNTTNDQPGLAWRGLDSPGSGQAWPGHDQARLGFAKPGQAMLSWPSPAWSGRAKPSVTWPRVAKPGQAWTGQAWSSLARRGLIITRGLITMIMMIMATRSNVSENTTETIPVVCSRFGL